MMEYFNFNGITSNIDDVVVSNPKRLNNKGYETWYPYYAGFSSDFVLNILNSLALDSNTFIADPWNGSGTTTLMASKKGYQSIGFDLNPVMIIAAKATLLNTSEFSSLLPLAHDIISKSSTKSEDEESLSDPLTTWFIPSSALFIRRIEKSIQRLLVESTTYSYLKASAKVNDLSCLASFYYVALFRTLRQLTSSYYTSNPTWIKIPDKKNRLRPNQSLVLETFKNEVTSMLFAIQESGFAEGAYSSLRLASSSAIPLESENVDLIITSPPYCTRIDYAVATLPELTLLGFHVDEDFKVFRSSLIGNSTVPKKLPKVCYEWGATCNKFLKQVLTHSSKASASYYFKNHVQYFDSIYNSIIEIKRVLKPGGCCILVVQDSYYKDIRNDLATIIKEMFDNNGVNLIRQENFISERNMDRINPNNKKYRHQTRPVESVLFLRN